MLVLIRGAGDLASGIALRLFRSGISVVMTDLPSPTAIRRTVAFSEAIVHGETEWKAWLPAVSKRQRRRLKH